MVPREKFQEDSQKAAKSKKSTGFAWTQKNCSGLSFTIQSPVNTGKLLLTSLTLSLHMYNGDVSIFSQEDQME